MWAPSTVNGSDRANILMEERIYAIRTSAHGSKYLPRNPARYDLTLKEAEIEKKQFETIADAVGGAAIIVTALDNHLYDH